MKKLTAITGVLATFLLSSLTVLAQTQTREDLLTQITAKRGELADLEQTFLSPSDEDRNQYADFLHIPNTGLIRLLPRQKFDSDVYKENQKSLTLRGGGAFYSFNRLTHEYGAGSDLALDQGQFSVGFAGADYGFMTNLGDLPLENVSIETPAAILFAAYKAAREEPLARTEYRRLPAGAELQGVPIKSRTPMRLNSTYLLRSVNYLNSDVLVAFRVVRIDTDGSAIILWKLLSKFETPKFNRLAPVVAG
jgi:hypothetical protein